MSIREQAREAQATEFSEHGTPEQQDLADKASALYDSIDALSSANRDLLVQAALSAVHGMLDGIVDGDVGLKYAARSILGIAGYANETNREDRGETSTGDRTVTSVLDDVREMVKAQMIALIGGERGQEVEAAAERVKDRIAAGEDPQTAANDEAEKIGLTHNHPTGPAKPPVTESSPAVKKDVAGLYL